MTVDDPRRPYKAIVAATIPILITAVQLAQIALGDGVWDVADTLNVILGILGAIAVYFTPNPPQ